jgi:hypothetical protein
VRCLICVAVVLGGCTVGESEPKVFGRVDCRRLADHPDLKRDFERIQTVCVERAKAAAAAGGAGTNTAGYQTAIGAGVAKSLTEQRIAEATLLSCMAENGYLYRTKEAMRPR